MKPQSIRAREYRRQRYEQGLCAACPQPFAKGKTLCEKHLQLSVERRIARRDTRRAQGLCGLCESPARPGRQSCAKHGNAAVATQAVVFARRKAAGLCGYGRCPSTAVKGRTLCTVHLRSLNEANAARSRDRAAKGMCRQCGNRPPMYGDSTFCCLCREKMGRDPLPLKMRRAIRRFWRLDRIDQRRAQAEAALAFIPNERTRQIFSLLQGLSDGVDHTLEETGKEFGVTRERIRQIQAKLYRWFESQGVALNLFKKPADIQRPRPKAKPRKVSKRQVRKEKARSLAGYAIKKGDLVKQPCARCGAVKTLAHHHDYSKPLDVVWLCHKHHAEAHGKQIQNKPPKKEYLAPCWLVNANPSSDLYDAPAIVANLSRLWVKQEQVRDVTGLKYGTIKKIINGLPVDDKDLGRMLRYVEALKQQLAA